MISKYLEKIKELIDNIYEEQPEGEPMNANIILLKVLFKNLSAELEARQSECNCKDWKINKPILDNYILYAEIHSVETNHKYFVYCPYCGHLLPQPPKE